MLNPRYFDILYEMKRKLEFKEVLEILDLEKYVDSDG